MAGTTVKAKLSEWIDADVIADAIIEQLQEWDIPPTFENCKKVWLDFLEAELSDGLNQSVVALFNKGEIK